MQKINIVKKRTFWGYLITIANSSNINIYLDKQVYNNTKDLINNNIINAKKIGKNIKYDINLALLNTVKLIIHDIHFNLINLL